MIPALAFQCVLPRLAAFMLAASLVVFLSTSAVANDAPDPPATDPTATRAPTIDFARQIQPILAKRCYACHGPDEAEGGLRFIDQASAYAETESGEHAIVPGDVDASMLIARVESDDEYEQMPPEGDRLTPDEIELLKGWIAGGAAWSDHWAFEPMVDHDPPAVSDPAWMLNPIDAFIRDGLDHVGLTPNDVADRRTLIRRAYYDLTGLPPTIAQVQSFVTDPDPLAFERLVDDRLQSPHYGERWGRHWLDLVRYAETNSFERDGIKPNAWKYRDYVIDSFNNDKPYDQFVREQLAGDELDNVTTETLTATGFYRLGIWDDEPADPLQSRADEMDDIITTTAQAFLGLTINCARCHDHKIDPIPQTDYFSMVAMLADVTTYGTRSDQESNNQIDVTAPEVTARYQQLDLERKRVEAAMLEIEQAGIAKMSAPDQRATEGKKRDRDKILKRKLNANLDDDQRSDYALLRLQRQQLDDQAAELPPRDAVLGLAKCNAHPEQTFVHFRGNPHSPADPVDPDFPTIFGRTAPTIPPADASASSAGRRRVLADWMVGEDNFLTARVMANRLWQFHFGRGIVRSSNNFGQLGTPPTHPELLDFLAMRLIEGGWKLKPMHRLIMSSRTYQMSSSGDQPGLNIDPNNDRFWRFDPRRLSAEEVRDSMLAATGSLNQTVGGPSFYEKLSAEVLAGQSRPGDGWGESSESERNRRSIYIHVKRSLVTPLLSAFDFPDPDTTCEDRFATLQPGQALSMLNSDFAHSAAQKLSASIDATNIPDDAIVRRTVARLLQRDATPADVRRGVGLINGLQNDYGVDRDRSIELFCLSVMNWNEFLFVD